MSFASPHFLTLGNIRAMLMSFSVEGIVVVGMTILLIVGGIDLSVGSVVRFAMVIAGSLFLIGLDPWSASLIGIIASGLIGCVMGFFVTGGRAPPFHRLAGGHGDRARPLPARHQGHAAVAVHAAARVQVHRAGHVLRRSLCHRDLRRRRRAVRFPAAPGNDLPQGVLHRQQREGGALFRHPDQPGEILDDDALCDAVRRCRRHLHVPLRFGDRPPSASAWSSTSSQPR